MAKTRKTSCAAHQPPAPHKARRSAAHPATAERKPRNLERRTAGVYVAHITHVEKIAIRRARRTVADAPAEREANLLAGFVPLPIAQPGDAMVVAHTMMMAGDLQAWECRRRTLVSPFAARSETGPKTAPKPLTFHDAGHGSPFRDLSPHDGGGLLDRRLPSGSPRRADRAVAAAPTARKKSARQPLDIALSPENDAAAPPLPLSPRFRAGRGWVRGRVISRNGAANPPAPHPNLLRRKREALGGRKRGEGVQPQRAKTFLNCQGSPSSMSSGKRPGRPVSGVQSV